MFHKFFTCPGIFSEFTFVYLYLGPGFRNAFPQRPTLVSMLPNSKSSFVSGILAE